jgi:hypothetical protein
MKEYYCTGCRRYHRGEPKLVEDLGRRKLCAVAVEARVTRKTNTRPSVYRTRQRAYQSGDLNWVTYL